MVAQTTPEEPINQVRLVGRISRDPEQRELPSGDTLWTFRLVVGRTGERAASRQTVDVLDCAVWGGRVQRSVAGWSSGDVVELGGSVRRRFFRGAAGSASRVEVEVTSGRLIRRAASG
ncbi:single-stranded DNA-binding protein [Nocardioides sp. W7]|uniref:single-stranded DNA-binding protein n=1 Tax=Nocardioides sp. W7 TaxID=2931390 RepID=UPI001FCFE3A6|nr:single-stranded DNA-binding protein [Nocardioides sp. W7]